MATAGGLVAESVRGAAPGPAARHNGRAPAHAHTPPHWPGGPESAVRQRDREHDELILGFVRTLVNTIDAKDHYTRGHSERVARIARRLGQELGLPEVDLRDLEQAGLLHDIGKIGINDRVLQKDGALTPDEFRHVQQHPMIGYTILEGLKSLRPVLPGVRNHHESYNGRGYPDGLAGDDIPLMARILAVADAFDAMKSDRPYRVGMPLEQVEEILRRGAGRQWDPQVIEAYFAARDEIARLAGPPDDDEDTVLLPADPEDACQA
ncbi:MAG TPA: HD-GYP domain-containing protein [Planctomycetaceae bacterium]|nr:HD-GYP domain-containing protein [Planctomycetaceae bacterium]